MSAEVEIEITSGHIRPIDVTESFASGSIIGGSVSLHGWSLRETTGTNPGQYTLQSGGSIVAEIVIPAGTTDTHWFGVPGIKCRAGLTMVPVGGETGAITGALYVKYDG